MVVTFEDAHSQGEQDASAARTTARSDGTHDNAMLPVFEIAEWVPAEYRQAYLDGAASVLGDTPLVSSWT